jgi:hypothetical protein
MIVGFTTTYAIVPAVGHIILPSVKQIRKQMENTYRTAVLKVHLMPISTII